MKKKVIEAISFLYQGERVVIKSSARGKFKVPVTETIRGQLKTRNKLLTAREVVEHEVIKKCDPTLYLQRGERLRVYPGGDPGYLPAISEGILTKHDEQSASPRSTKLDKDNKISTKFTAPADSIYSMYRWDEYDFTDDYDDS